MSVKNIQYITLKDLDELDITNLETKVTDLETKVGNAQTEIESLQTITDTLNDDIHTMDTTITNLNTTVGTNSTNIVDLGNRTTTIENSYQSKTSQLNINVANDSVAYLNNTNGNACYLSLLANDTRYLLIGRETRQSADSSVYAEQGNLNLKAKSGSNVVLGNNLNANSKSIYGLATPTADNQATPKSYVDSIKSTLKTVVASATDFDNLKEVIANW